MEESSDTDNAFGSCRRRNALNGRSPPRQRPTIEAHGRDPSCNARWQCAQLKKPEKDPQARKALKHRGRSGWVELGGVLENLPARKGQEKTSERPCSRAMRLSGSLLGPAYAANNSSSYMRAGASPNPARRRPNQPPELPRSSVAAANLAIVAWCTAIVLAMARQLSPAARRLRASSC